MNNFLRMCSHFFVIALVSLGVLIGAGSADAADPLKEKLDKAEKVYNEAAEELELTIKRFIEKEILSATSSGNTDIVERLNAEMDFFEKRGFVPFSMPAKYHRDQIAAAQRYVKVADATIRAYTRAKDLEAAKNAQRQRDEIAAVAIRSTVRSQLVGAWKLKMPNYSSNFVFRPDGTMTHTTSNIEMDWRIDPDKGQVICETPGHGTERIILPLNPRGTKGFGSQGGNYTLTKTR